MKQPLIIAVLLAIGIGFSACGGGGGSSSDGTSTATTVTGTFVDDPVAGLNYECSPSGKSGTTNSAGEYTCNEGDTVQFKLGSLVLGTPITAVNGAITTPYDIFPNDTNAAINLARLLQTLDTDTSDNVITPNTTLTANLSSSYDFTATEVEFENAVESDIGDILVSAEDAKQNMDESVTSAGGTVPPITYSWQTETWGICTGECGTDNGTQTRTVTCKASDGSTVADSMCTDTKPTTTQACTASECTGTETNTSDGLSRPPMIPTL